MSTAGLRSFLVGELGLQIAAPESLLALAGCVALAVVLAMVGISLRTRGLSRKTERLEAELLAKSTELSSAAGRVSTLEGELAEKSHQLETANARLERFSLEDELTGLANRRALHARLEEELSRTLRHGSKLSIVLFDLDHFKVVNDELGHEEGDRCLERVGGLVRDRLRRRADLAARYGGEEFALVLPDTALAGALTVAELLRAGISALELGVGTGRGPLTASFGVAQAAIDGSDRVVDLIRRAEQALERAKQEGRDHVVAAPTPAVGRS